MQPLRIQCRPIGLFVYPIPAGVWLMLDSLIYRAVLLETMGSDYYALPPLSPSSTELIDVPIPLERREVGGVWYYACSWANVEANSLGQHVTNWVRSYSDFDATNYLSDKKRLLIKTWEGVDKLYNMPMHCYTIDTLTWYAVGNLDGIKHILETYYPAIGKKTAYGQGQLAYYKNGDRWQVEPWADDWSERDTNGVPTRGLPVNVSEGAWPLDVVRCGIRPPYYVQANQFFVEKISG